MIKELDDNNLPKIFTDDSSSGTENNNIAGNIKNEKDPGDGNLFDEENNIEEDDFEIPAFLRKQKYS